MNNIESYTIGKLHFKIIPQSESEYAIRVNNENEIFWLKHPSNRFETLGGCYHSILLFLEECSEVGK